MISSDIYSGSGSGSYRFESAEEYEKVAGSYCVDAALMMKAKKKMIVMHPLPR